MTFSLNTMTEVSVLDVRTLTAKDRKPDDLPGAQLLLQALLPAESLNMFHPSLTGWLFRKSGAGKQQQLEGLEGLELSEAGKHVPRMPWAYEQTGCTVEIDRGIGGKRGNLVLEDTKMHRVSLQPQQSGGVKMQWTLDAPGLSDDTRGKLSGLKSTKIKMALLPPSLDDDPQRDIEDEEDDAPVAADKHADGTWPFPQGLDKKTPAQTAADAFAAAEAAGQNKDASEVAKPARKKRTGRPSLTPVE